MPNYICVQCGVQFAASDNHPARCPICQDERQYVSWKGQQWTTLAELRQNHKNVIRQEARGLYGIGTDPPFAIGQRALLIQAPGGNILWDCITVLDDETIDRIRALGGISAIAISHPHFYSSLVEWSRAFGDAPVYLHADDRQWVMRPDPCIHYWEGDTCTVGEGLTLINAGVHFAGGTMLHWAQGAGGKGALLAGDIFQVAQDRRFVSFMYSYPNYIPERPPAIRRALELVDPFSYEAIHGGWWERNILADAKSAVQRSAERYLRQVGDQSPDKRD